MKLAVIIDAVRTPIGRASADKGIFRDARSEDLSAHVMNALIERTGIDPHAIEDVRGVVCNNRVNRDLTSRGSRRLWPDCRSRLAE